MERFLDCIKALSDETRLSCLTLLLKYNFCVGALANRLNVSEAAISQHLKVLQKCDLVENTRQSNFIYYTVNTDKLMEISKAIEEMTKVERNPCNPTIEGCPSNKRQSCKTLKECTDGTCCKNCRVCPKNQASSE